MQPALSASGLPLEVLDDIGHVGIVAIDPRILERSVEDSAGRAHEWFPREVLAVARLLSYEHHPRRGRPDPNTVWVPERHKGQARQSAAARRSLGTVGRDGISSSAGLCLPRTAPLAMLVDRSATWRRRTRLTCGETSAAARGHRRSRVRLPGSWFRRRVDGYAIGREAAHPAARGRCGVGRTGTRGR